MEPNIQKDEKQNNKDYAPTAGKQLNKNDWEQSFIKMNHNNDDVLLDPAVPTTFDRNEWDWS